jgi:uncharacterized protein (DUF1330 family)
MKTEAALLTVGVVVGVVGAQGLGAQSKPPVYMLALNEITDPEGYAKEYLPTAQATIKDHGGRYVAAGKGVVVDGDLGKGRVIVLRWDSFEQLQGWRRSPEYEKIRKVGERFAKFNVVAVEGVQQ